MKLTQQRRLYHLRRIDALFREIGFHTRCLCECVEVDGEQVEAPSREDEPVRFNECGYPDRSAK